MFRNLFKKPSATVEKKIETQIKLPGNSPKSKIEECIKNTDFNNPYVTRFCAACDYGQACTRIRKRMIK